MAVEIRELVIKTTVDNSSSGSGASSQSSSASSQEDVVRECVDQVMELLRRQKER